MYLLAPFPVIPVANFVLFVHLSAHLLIPGNILIPLLSTAVQDELLAFGASRTVIGTVTGVRSSMIR